MICRIMIFAAVLSIATSAFCDTTHTETYLSATYGSKLGILSQGDTVSGTSVEFETSWHLDPIGAAEPRVTSVKDVFASNLKISISGETIFTDDVHEYGLGNYQALKPKFRFASTHFPDGSDISITVEAIFKCYVGGTPTLKNYSHTYTVKSWNKLQLLGTNRASNGNYNSDFYQLSYDVGTSATGALSASHSVNPSAPATGETMASILAKLKDSTVFAAVTHGSQTAIESSNLSEQLRFQQDILPAVNSKTTDDAKRPPFSIVALWSCATFGSDAYGAFNVGVTNTAYLGFDKSVSRLLWSHESYAILPPGQAFPSGNPDTSLAEHAKKFWSLMSQGEIAQESLNQANLSFPPIKRVDLGNGIYSNESAPMRLNGDKFARLQFVYLNSADRANTSNTSIWWIKL